MSVARFLRRRTYLISEQCTSRPAMYHHNIACPTMRLLTQLPVSDPSLTKRAPAVLKLDQPLLFFISIPHFYMWGRYGTIVASMQLGRTPPLLTVPSLSDRLSDSPSTSSSVFLSCFYTHHPLSYVLLVSSHHMPVPSHPAFLDLL